MSCGVQNRTLGLVRDWTPVPEGTVELAPGPGLPALRSGRDMKGNLSKLFVLL